MRVEGSHFAVEKLRERLTGTAASGCRRERSLRERDGFVLKRLCERSLLLSWTALEDAASFWLLWALPAVGNRELENASIHLTKM